MDFDAVKFPWDSRVLHQDCVASKHCHARQKVGIPEPMNVTFVLTVDSEDALHDFGG